MSAAPEGPSASGAVGQELEQQYAYTDRELNQLVNDVEDVLRAGA